jgi:ribose 5-phosphate isomerase B
MENEGWREMRIALGSDHAGFLLKEEIRRYLIEQGHEVHDLGAYNPDPSDYPDFAKAVARSVAAGQTERGILVCGTGVGVAIVANKVRGMRAALCHDPYTARYSVIDDDVKILCLGERVIGTGLALETVQAFLAAAFSGAERHCRRIGKIAVVEEEEVTKPSASSIGG